ncbi:MAG: cation:proton antiporter [Acidobacteriota bacterium]
MSLLLVQIMIVLILALICGNISLRLGQARVIGEIFGGIFLGPSVFGRLFPHASAAVFPANSLGSLEVLSNIGLILFLLIIGSELDFAHLRKQTLTVSLASAMSILLPFMMAMFTAHAIRSRFAPHGIGGLAFTLFLGISLSITAFPVLARILEERGLQTSKLGATALMCAAFDDVCAWSLLAAAVAMLHNGASTSTPRRLLYLAGYLAVMIGVIRPLGKWIARRYAGKPLSYELLGVFLAIVLASAAATDAIGVHPLFGAFIAGLCFPRVKPWQQALRTRLDMVVSILLLPLFFALTGMKTRLDLLNDSTTWLWTGIVLLIAVVGKVGGAVIAARFTRQSWKNAWALGFLLNTRGLVELIVLNIAYDAHVFSPALFTMLVVMALLTTMATTPLLNWIGIENNNLDRPRLVIAEAA